MFASARERKLWIWTAASVAAVYSTLALSSVLPDVLYSQGFAAVAFLTAMALVAVMVLTQGLRVRPRGLEIGIGIGIAVVYGMVLFRMTIPERSHLIEYGVVAVFFYEALSERSRSGRPVAVPGLIAIIATSLVGAIDEAVQLWLPHRVFDPVDILFNSLAATSAVSAMALLGWIRGRLRGSEDRA